MTPFDLLLIVLATYALAWFVARMSGPWGFMLNIRKALGTPPGAANDYQWCWKCAAFWAGLLMLVCWYWQPAQPYGYWWVVLWAVLGGAVMLASWTGANHD